MNEGLITRKCSATGAVVLAGLIAFLALPGCRDDAPSNVDTHAHEHEEAAAAPTSRIDIPPSVRQNLGITFVKVERRPVRSTVRIAGEFELRPEARREYHVMLPGRIELLVRQYEPLSRQEIMF